MRVRLCMRARFCMRTIGKKLEEIVNFFQTVVHDDWSLHEGQVLHENLKTCEGQALRMAGKQTTPRR